MSSAQDRLSAISSHVRSGNYPTGLLRDQVAIITGSGQGIGRSCALKFAREGAKVVVSDLDKAKAEAVVEEIKKEGGQAIAVVGDVTADDFPKRLIGETVKAFGTVDHIVNNAGFTFDKMLHTTTDEGFELILKVHNVAPFRIIREAAPYFRSKDPERIKANKSIVNISSIAGYLGNVGQVNYATAKAGVVGMTKTIAREWGPMGVRANTACFGYVETRLTQDKGLNEAIEVGGKKIALGIPQPKGGNANKGAGIPLGRPASPDEAANAVLFLCSPLASFVTGHNLLITGGQAV